MDLEEYRRRGKEVVDFIADYLGNIRQYRVFPDVEPGYMRDHVPDRAPVEGEDWDKIFADFHTAVMPGMTHWQSPRMHAYFPALNSPPSLLGDMLAEGLNPIAFSWASSPVCSELEIIVMDWLAQMLGLPEHFLHKCNTGCGGGCILTTASEGTLVSLLAARRQAINNFRLDLDCDDLTDSEINSRLIAYCSDQANSSVEKAAIISLVQIRFVPSDDKFSMRGADLRRLIEEDLKRGLQPFYVCATLGTTGTCAFDVLHEIGPVCEKFDLWLHVDAAYAGSSFVCPEFRHPMRGIEFAESFVFNPSKWLLVNFDCTALWVKDSRKLHNTFNIEKLYLKHEKTGVAIDFMHWQIPLSKKFRSLKLWFVLRSYGVSGLQSHIRRSVQLAKCFEAKIRGDSRFEIIAERHLGLVTFRLKGENANTETLLKRVNKSGQIHMVSADLRGRYIIRYAVTSPMTTEADLEFDYSVISSVASHVLCEAGQEAAAAAALHANLRYKPPPQQSAAGQRRRIKEYRMSLLLSNVTSLPKFVDSSYAALTDSRELARDFRSQLSLWVSDRPLSFSPMSGPRGRAAAAAAAAAMRGQKSLDFGGGGGCGGGGLTPPSRRLASGRGTPLLQRGRLNSLDSKVDELVVAAVVGSEALRDAAVGEADEKEEAEAEQEDDDDEEEEGEEEEGDKESGASLDGEGIGNDGEEENNEEDDQED